MTKKVLLIAMMLLGAAMAFAQANNRPGLLNRRNPGVPAARPGGLAANVKEAQPQMTFDVR